MKNTKQMVLCALFIAIILLMAWTPLGYLHLGAIEITFMAIPVTIGAIILGKNIGALLGGIFGITSFLQCLGIMGASPFGQTLFNINPIFTILLCMVPRLLMGYLSGLIFELLYNKNKVLAFSLSGISGALLNTVLFTGMLVLLFGNSDYISGLRAGKGILDFCAAFVGINGIIEAVVAFLVASNVSAVLYRFAKK